MNLNLYPYRVKKQGETHSSRSDLLFFDYKYVRLVKRNPNTKRTGENTAADWGKYRVVATEGCGLL